jgi:hypothetical protein
MCRLPISETCDQQDFRYQDIERLQRGSKLTTLSLAAGKTRITRLLRKKRRRRGNSRQELRSFESVGWTKGT